MRFSDEEIRRYGRQMVLPEVGGIGQERLRSARLLAESEVEALYLAGAGVGHIEVPSLVIKERVTALNPLVEVTVVEGETAPNDVLSASLRALFQLRAALTEQT